PREGGGGTTFSASRVPPAEPSRPEPLPPRPVLETPGGGGTTLAVADAPPEDPAVEWPRPEPELATDGGGGTTLELISVPRLTPLGFPKVLPPDMPGGGGTTFALNEVPFPPVVPPPLTVGGGGTTSVVPKILPSMLLMSDPLPTCVGGGGTTVLVESGTLPLARRCKSGEISEVGGGAITEGVGIVSRAVADVSRSGEDTGGGTTAAFVICTAERVISRLETAGAGGTTVVARAGALRVLSRETLGAGATTGAPSAGATSV